MDVIKDLEKKFQVIAGALKQEFAGIRSNRPTAKLVEDVKVDYFGQRLSVKQLGSISVILPREINISAWDKNAAGIIAKAIEVSNLGVSVSADGNLVRVVLPVLTEERRKELTKLIKGLTEQSKIKVRALRDEANKKAKDLPEDQKFKLKDQIQDAVDKTNKEIEDSLESKIKEINE